jgi:hypothetical protein
MSPLVSWLFFKAQAKRPSRPILTLAWMAIPQTSAKMERDGSSEQLGKTAN